MKEYVSFEELYDAYLECRKHKRSAVNALKFELDDNVLLLLLYIDLNTKQYVIGKSIAFVVNEPKPREIFAADFKDRIVHHLIIRRILKYIEADEWIQDTYSTRKDKGTLYGIKRITNQIESISKNYTEQTWLLKLDLRACFVSVDKNKLYDWLSKFITQEYNNEIKNDTNVLTQEKLTNELQYNIWLIEQIIYNKPQENCILKMDKTAWKYIEICKSLFGVDKNEDRGFAVGNLTSLIFVNFFLSKLDHYIVNDLKFNKDYNCGYGRYVDDFILVSQDKTKLLSAYNDIKLFCEIELGLKLSPNKHYMQEVKKGVNFIGSTIKPGRTYVLNRTKGNFYKKLLQWYIYSKKCIKQNIQIPYKDLEMFVCVVNSYLGFLSQHASFNIRKQMLSDEQGFMKYWKQYIDIDTKNYKKISIKRNIKQSYLHDLYYDIEEL